VKPDQSVSGVEQKEGEMLPVGVLEILPKDVSCVLGPGDIKARSEKRRSFSNKLYTVEGNGERPFGEEATSGELRPEEERFVKGDLERVGRVTGQNHRREFTEKPASREETKVSLVADLRTL
jgi:hypothetical protein